MNEQQIEDFWNQGYIVLDKFFTDNELSFVSNDVDELVESLAQKLKREKKIQELYENEGAAKRLTLIENDCPGSAVVLHTMAARTLGKGIGSLFTNKKLLDVVESLLGPNIAGHPEWNVRPKTPSNPLFEVPWHQDTAYLEEGNEKYVQIVAWIALTDANSQNGGLQIASKAHNLKKCFTHTIHDRKGSWYLQIEETELYKNKEVKETDIKTIDVNRGDLLLFTNLTPHRSTPNLTDCIRWSVDIRFMRPQDPSGFSGATNTMVLRSLQNNTNNNTINNKNNSENNNQNNTNDNNERKTQDFPIDWSVWGDSSGGEFLMKRDDNTENNDSNNNNTNIENDNNGEEISGPWMDRWRK